MKKYLLTIIMVMAMIFSGCSLTAKLELETPNTKEVAVKKIEVKPIEVEKIEVEEIEVEEIEVEEIEIEERTVSDEYLEDVSYNLKTNVYFGREE